MKYKNEKPWQPKEENYMSLRKKKRDLEKFFNKIQKKGTEFIKWIFNNFLSDNQKQRLFNLYLNDIKYYKFISDREINFNRILNNILYKEMLDEKDYKALKRKWIVSKLLK